MYKSNSINLDDKLTKQLVGRIFAETDLSKFRYEMLNYENDLQKILKNKYFVSINFYGTNCLLVFTKVLDKFYSFTVDRQTLSYNFSKVDFSKVKLNLVNIHLDDQIYNGTIFEGILVKRYNMDDVYIISDVYKFCGKDMTKDKLNIKFLNIVSYLKCNYDKDIKTNNLELEVNKLFELNKFDHLINDVMPKVKNLKCRGICFYPEISETKLIFNNPIDNQSNLNKSNFNQSNDNKKNFNQSNHYNSNDNNSNDNKSNLNQSNDNKSNHYNSNDNKSNDNNSNDNKSNFKKPEQNNKIEIFDKFDKKVKYFNESNENVFAILDMKRTDNPDVYKLFCVEKEVDNKKTVLKKVSCGIAHIRGIDASHKIKKLFENNKSILMKCKFNNDNSKWEPLEQEKTQKIPTLIDEIESKLVMMEISDDEM